MDGRNSSANYNLVQVFGDKNGRVAEEDIISAVEFDQTGKYLSLGDRAGRLIIFDAQQVKNKKTIEYSYYTEFQSHIREFDQLRSVDIQERIQAISWLAPQGKNQFVATANSNKIKLWKLSHRPLKKVIRSAGKELNMPKLQVVEEGLVPTLKRTFPTLHTTSVNSVSQSNNQQYLLSSDLTKLYLWNIEEPNKAFVPVDIKPDKIEEADELITFSKYHPTSDSLFAYGTSKGTLKMGDMRQAAICDSSAINFKYESNVARNFFSDIVSSYSSATFTNNERYLAARDFLSVKIWDVAMPNKPLNVIPIQESLKSKLYEMFDNEHISDSFSISANRDSRTLVTGSFNSHFHFMDLIDGTNTQYELSFNRKTISKPMTNKVETLGNIDYARSTNYSRFSPKGDTAVVASLNCFFIYSL